MKRKIYENVIVFLLGCFTYGLIEVIFRGYTHWTMLLTGGIVFLLLYVVNLRLRTRSLLLRGIIGCGIITGIEFFVGFLVNIIFKLSVWDYSGLPLNFLGQICPLFSMWWFFLSIPMVYLCVFIHRRLNKALI